MFLEHNDTASVFISGCGGPKLRSGPLICSFLNQPVISVPPAVDQRSGDPMTPYLRFREIGDDSWSDPVSARTGDWSAPEVIHNTGHLWRTPGTCAWRPVSD